MVVIRFEIFDADGNAVTPPFGGMSASPAGLSAEDDPRSLLHGAPAGYRVRLWKDVPAIGPLSELGEPHAEVVA